MTSFATIASSYDAFVVDIWGVVHNGKVRLPGVLEALQYLQSQNKRVFFLSNMPYPQDAVAQHLAEFGVTPDLYEAVYSSGQCALDYCVHMVKKGAHNVYHWGHVSSMQNKLSALGLHFVTDVSLADFILLTHEESESRDMKAFLQTALEHNIPILCTNPDQAFIVGNTVHTAAGSLAAFYEQMGGHVDYVGKPYAYIYQQLQATYKLPSKVLAIGDTLEVDIIGAQQMGWDTLLVLTGVSGQSWDPESREQGIVPSYVLADLESFS